jgi:hypothetical protein
MNMKEECLLRFKIFHFMKKEFIYRVKILQKDLGKSQNKLKKCIENTPNTQSQKLITL